jgi:hypothetical protein
MSPTTGADSKPRRSLWRRRWFWGVVAAVVAIWVLIGPWPVRRGHFHNTPYELATLARLQSLPLSFPEGPLRAGVASVVITPPLGEPLGGYSARDPMSSEGVLDFLHAKAITLSNGARTITVLGGDILLILPDLRSRILANLGLSPEDVYFTATHTHSGPGGFGPGRIEQISLGSYDERISDRLAGQFAEAVRVSRKDLRPVSVCLVRAEPDPPLVANRVLEGAPVDNTLSCVCLCDAEGAIVAGLVSYSAHPTCFGRRNRQISGDYPGAAQTAMEEQLGGTWLFAAGAVGSMKLVTTQPRGERRRDQFAPRLANCAIRAVRQHLTSTAPRVVGASTSLGSAILAIDLPPTQARLAKSLVLSPAVTALLLDRNSYIHVLAIDDLILLGLPCDYSGELARVFAERSGGESPESGANTPYRVLTTSFNGNYIGYLLPRDRYDLDHYEARTMSLYGPWCGEYLQEVSVRLVDRVERALLAAKPEPAANALAGPPKEVESGGRQAAPPPSVTP